MYIRYIHIYIYKDKIKERMELLSLDRPGRLTDATRGYKNEKKVRETQAHGYIHTIYTHLQRD